MLREHLKVGQECEVSVISENPLELSIRKTQPDPWVQTASSFKVGDTMRGVVVQTLEKGALIEIEAGFEVKTGAWMEVVQGVPGFIPNSVLAPFLVSEPEEAVFVGDRIEAKVMEIDHKKQNLLLSIADHLKDLDNAKVKGYGSLRSRPISNIGELQAKLLADLLADFYVGRSAEECAQSVRAVAEMDAVIVDLALQAGIHSVLVVDDVPEVVEALANRFSQLVPKADKADRRTEALKKVHDEVFDLALVDINMLEGDGWECCTAIRESSPHTEVALITGEKLSISGEAAEAEARRRAAVGFWKKPIDNTKLLEIFQWVAQARKRTELPFQSGKTATEGTPISPVTPPSVTAIPSGITPVDLQGLLDGICRKTEATCGGIFLYHPTTRVMALEARCNLDTRAFETICRDLEFSPIYDVICDRRSILEADANGETVRPRFHYLLPLTAFNACVGVPVKVMGEVNRALFLFSP